jgi:membrane protease YdiL (CAAX protease family)
MQKLISDSYNFQIHPFWRGHLFLFQPPKVKTYNAQQGFKMLLVFLLMEIILRPLILFCSKWFEITDRYWWTLVNVTILTILVFLLVRIFIKIRGSQLGLYAWKNWSKTEKLYFIQIIPIATIVFSFFTSEKLKVLFTRPNLLDICLFSFIPQIIWGFYQELLYRGILQTELVRRLGSWKGILASNLIFTFGPLHAYHFLAAQKNPSHLWIFAATFAIGFIFAIIFKRSGNLWIIGIMHGIGNMFLNGLAKI